MPTSDQIAKIEAIAADTLYHPRIRAVAVGQLAEFRRAYPHLFPGARPSSSSAPGASSSTASSSGSTGPVGPRYGADASNGAGAKPSGGAGHAGHPAGERGAEAAGQADVQARARVVPADEGVGRYRLPSNYNEAYNLLGDGVAVDVVRFLAAHILEPVLGAVESDVTALELRAAE